MSNHPQFFSSIRRLSVCASVVICLFFVLAMPLLAQGHRLSQVEGPVLSDAEGPVLSQAEGPVLSQAEGPVLSQVEGSAAPLPGEQVQLDVSPRGPDGAGATFDIRWSVGCQTPPTQAVTGLAYAAELWGTWISSTVPIEVSACWTANLSGGDALGTGMPTMYVRNLSNAMLVDTYYPIALANALSGSDLKPERADIALQFKADVAWSFVTTTAHTTAPTAGEDFIAVALHEIAHGLGFIGNMYEDYNIGFCGDGLYGSLYPCPTVYDKFVVDSSGIALLDYRTPDPRELGTRLKSDANFGGPNTLTANGGMAAKLYTPGYWQFGSSLSHLDQNTFQVGENRLMTPSYSGVTRHPGPVTLATLQDMGWLRADGVPNVTTAGPLVVGVGQGAIFGGTLLWSDYAGQPVTYTWTAADQVTVTHPGLTRTDSVTFTWATPGEKRLALSAVLSAAPPGNGVTSAAATRAALVFDVVVNGAAQGDANVTYTFDANVTPGSGGFPITYTWEATGLDVVHQPGQGTSASTAFRWTAPGTKTVTVTVRIAGAMAQAVHQIGIEGLVLDQFIFLPLVQRQ